MEENLEKGLVSRYPSLYRYYKGNPGETCMAWGFSCGDGWYLILEDLSQKIISIDKDKRVVADQVKQKFGGLRFYFHVEGKHQDKHEWYHNLNHNLRHWWYWSVTQKIPKYYKFRNFLVDLRRKYLYRTLDEKVSDFVGEAESKSYKTCERCGNEGKTRGKGWVRTLCDSCDESDEKYD